MEIWPAIDLRGGHCVRLRQGDYQRETVFGDDPAAMARHWVDLGAERKDLLWRGGGASGWVECIANCRWHSGQDITPVQVGSTPISCSQKGHLTCAIWNRFAEML